MSFPTGKADRRLSSKRWRFFWKNKFQISNAKPNAYSTHISYGIGNLNSFPVNFDTSQIVLIDHIHNALNQCRSTASIAHNIAVVLRRWRRIGDGNQQRNGIIRCSECGETENIIEHCWTVSGRINRSAEYDQVAGIIRYVWESICSIAGQKLWITVNVANDIASWKYLCFFFVYVLLFKNPYFGLTKNYIRQTEDGNERN